MKPYLALALLALCAARHPTPSRDRVVNDVLDMTLQVGAEWRGRHPTWEQIQTEVCARMGVKRIAPWERRR